MVRNDAAANAGKKPVTKQDEALDTLEKLIQIPLQDVEELMKYAEKGDFKGGRRAAKRIRRRINKYGI